jgi:ribosome recycling factor
MFDEMEDKLKRVVEHVKQDLNGIKTGRAKPSLIEHVLIEAYEGQRMQLVELASISAPDPHMLLVQPWDQSVISKIEKGLATSEMHFNPVVDGQVIRISIPPLTEERRRELVKLVGQKLEAGKEMMRGIRNETKRDIDEKKGKDGVSEDDVRGWMEEMQTLHDTYITQLDDLGEAKEKELMEI